VVNSWEEQEIFSLSKAPRMALGLFSLPFDGYRKKWLGHESKAMNSNEWKLPLHPMYLHNVHRNNNTFTW
jgi:hypothetical protein